MVKTYSELHRVVSAAIDSFLTENQDKEIAFSVADNGACSMVYAGNGNKMTFLLAKFAEEYKVGYAFFEAGEAQPDWLDDVYNTEFDEAFVLNLINDQLLEQAL